MNKLACNLGGKRAQFQSKRALSAPTCAFLTTFHVPRPAYVGAESRMFLLGCCAELLQLWRLGRCHRLEGLGVTTSQTLPQAKPNDDTEDIIKRAAAQVLSQRVSIIDGRTVDAFADIEAFGQTQSLSYMAELTPLSGARMSEEASLKQTGNAIPGPNSKCEVAHDPPLG
eukprot:3566234-Amphidinium_carterae.1